MRLRYVALIAGFEDLLQQFARVVLVADFLIRSGQVQLGIDFLGEKRGFVLLFLGCIGAYLFRRHCFGGDLDANVTAAGAGASASLKSKLSPSIAGGSPAG